MRWKLGFGDSSKRSDEPRQTRAIGLQGPAQTQPDAATFLPHLDEMGQRGELLRVRVGQLAERLEELKSLSAAFGEIVEPVAAISAELPKAQVRNAELEGLLARERDFATDLRRTVTDLTARANGYAADLSSAQGDIQRFEATLRERDAEIQDLRALLLDKSQVADDLSRQFSAELERTRALQTENKSLRGEVQTLDQSLTRVGRDFAEASERLALSEQESRRLQLLGEEQATRLSDLTARAEVLAEESNAMRERLNGAEARAAAEQAAREKAEAQAQGEQGVARAEIANLNLRLEAASSRASGLERLLGQVRAQLREREEALRASERAFKEAEAERLSHERRLEGLQAELVRANERLTDAQQARSDVTARCDMLTKALAAKDAALEQALSRASLLSDQAEQLSRRGSVERSELEATIRRLTEELHNERSERALARGALDIARESRAALQKQYEALKRSGRVLDPGEATQSGGAPALGESEAPNNVRNFPPPDRT